MNILDVVMSARDGGAVRQLGSQFGLGEDQTAAVMSALVPQLAAGFQRNLKTEDGLSGLVSALSTGNHQRYLDDAAALASASADGNGILGHVFGDKAVSREVASRAAAQTGVNADVIKQMLPLAATLMMGAFARQQSGGSASLAGTAGGGNLMEMLTPLLDQDRDGSIIDDVTKMMGRFLGQS